MENLEKNIKDKLQQSKIDIDTSELWNEVYPHIKPNRRKRFFIYLFFGLAWLLSLGVVGWHFSSSSVDDSHSRSIAKITESKTQTTASNTLLENAKSANKTSPKIEIENQSAIESTLSRTYNQDSHDRTNVNTEPETKSDVMLESTEGVEEFINHSSGRTTPVSNQSNNLISTNVNRENRNANYLPIIEESEVIDDERNSIKLKPKTINQIDASTTKRLNFSNTKLNTSKLNLAYTIPQPVIPTSMYSEYIYDSEFTAFSLYALGGFASIDKVLTAVNNVPSSNLMDRATSESPLESISGELGISYMITPNLQLSAGINYIRVNERVEDSYSVTDTVLLENVIIENIISSRGSEPVYGNIQSQRTINTDLRAYNRYSDLALSADLTYLMGEEVLKPYLSIGIQQSISSTHTGYWLLDTNNLYDISKDENDYLSNNYGLALRFGAGVSFGVSDRTSLRLGGRYTKYINAVTNDNYELSQKYNLLGLSAGMNIKI